MKKILFVVDYFLSEYNSVRDILSAIIKSEELSDYEFVFAKSDGNAYYPLDIEKTDYTHYTSNRTYFKWLFSKDYTFIKKISIFFNKIRYGIAYLMKDKKLLEKKYLEKIIK